MQKPPKAGCGYAMAFLIFLLVVGGLFFVDFRLVRNETTNSIAWCDDADGSDDEWELFDTVRVGKVKVVKK